jgi:hypothetical protein
VRGSVGIIANPLAGSDIRRLVALGSVTGTQEKINIVQRVLSALQALDVVNVYLMPDIFGIAHRALEKLPCRLERVRKRSQVIGIPVDNTAADSTHAAREMRHRGAGCIVVLGGDGTVRAVAEGCQDVPILPVSTGTNNVISDPVEGTVAGLAAGFVALHPEFTDQAVYRSKRLEVQREGDAPSSALVDVALVIGDALGSRAVWDPSLVCMVIVTRGEPGAVGMSSVAGLLSPVRRTDPWGLCFSLGRPDAGRVTVPLAPGLVTSLDIQEWHQVPIDQSIIVQGGGRLLALDGEREVVLREGQHASITLRRDGPLVVDALRALRVATEQGFFRALTISTAEQALEEHVERDTC